MWATWRSITWARSASSIWAVTARTKSTTPLKVARHDALAEGAAAALAMAMTMRTRLDIDCTYALRAKTATVRW